jgi:hypothetical protein
MDNIIHRFLFIKLFIIMKIIITEQQNDKLNQKIKLVIEKLGLEQSREMFGDDRIRQVYNNNPSLFLERYNDLVIVEKYDDDVLEINYVDKNGDVVFYYNKNHDRNKSIYVYYDIWKFLDIILDEPNEGYVASVLKKWLKDIYNLDGMTIGYMLSKININD